MKIFSELPLYGDVNGQKDKRASALHPGGAVLMLHLDVLYQNIISIIKLRFITSIEFICKECYCKMKMHTSNILEKKFFAPNANTSRIHYINISKERTAKMCEQSH